MLSGAKHTAAPAATWSSISSTLSLAGPQRGLDPSGLPATSGSQPGDPARAASAILRALASDKAPLRLALGNDAADMIAAYLDSSRAEFSAWEPITRSTDYGAV